MLNFKINEHKRLRLNSLHPEPKTEKGSILPHTGGKLDLISLGIYILSRFSAQVNVQKIYGSKATIHRDGDVGSCCRCDSRTKDERE